MADEKLKAEQEIDQLFLQLNSEAEHSGCHLNPDRSFTRELVRGLVTNIKRYGYMACPCRLASGKRDQDLDIICPCDYRDPDLTDWGACYCALYVTREVMDGKQKLTSIPERRPVKKETEEPKSIEGTEVKLSLKYPVWRCKVCGYLCARQTPPEECPICHVPKDRFERLL